MSRRYGPLDHEARYRLITEYSRDLISICDPGGVFQYVSPSHEVLLGYTAAELEGTCAFDLQHDSDREQTTKRFAEMVFEGVPKSGEFRFRRKDGSWIWVEAQGTPVMGDDGTAIEIVTVARDITQRKASEEQIRFLAYHDPMTGLPNRQYFREEMDRLVSEAGHHGEIGAVLVIDVMRLKEINDTMGHSFGDEVIRMVTERLAFCVGESDVFARIGGDEFALGMTHVSAPSDAEARAQKVIQLLNEPVFIDRYPTYVGCNIGIALYPADGQDTDTLVKHADTAMFEAKTMGKSAYVLYTAELTNQAYERLRLKNDLYSALDREEFFLEYQPILSAESGQIVAVEALLRWQHPTLGLVSPADFIPVAEETGLIIPIGEWVLRTACKNNQEWRHQGLPTIRTAINFSPYQFRDHDLHQTVQSILEETGMDPAALDIEITETALVRNTDITLRILSQLKAMGIRVCLDDFGTGYSSLAYLTRFPIDVMKIDQSFVRGLGTSRNHLTITSAIISLAQNLHMNVIAEGVENDDQWELLKGWACDEVQGFRFSRSVSADRLPGVWRSLNQADDTSFPPTLEIDRNPVIQ